MTVDKSTIVVDAVPIASAGVIPNNPRLPLLRYRGLAGSTSEDLASWFETVFGRNQWGNGWRNGVYPYTHWHCTAHEVLGVFSGTAEVQVGGETGPTVTIEKGDVVLVPAGVAHKRLDESPGLGIVGAYPDGQTPDLCRGEESLEQALARVSSVALPSFDPVFASDGFMQNHWQ